MSITVTPTSFALGKIEINQTNNKQKKMILNNLDFLINNNKMGEIFHVISISNKNLNTIEGFNK